jgi:lysophospholipase L1-like esterase
MVKKLISFLALGDSYTAGENVSSDQNWPSQLVKLLLANGISIPQPVILAQTGWTTKDLLAAINQTNLPKTFDLVSLMIGVNNQYDGLGLEGYKRDFSMLLEQAICFAQGDQSRVLVLSIPDWGKTPFAAGQDRDRIGMEVEAFNQVNRTETIEASAHYVDITPNSQRALLESALLADDNLHPSEKMYADWVEIIFPVVEIILNKVGEA